MKKFLVLILSLAMVLSLSACGSSGSSKPAPAAEPAATASTAEASSPAEAAPAEAASTAATADDGKVWTLKASTYLNTTDSLYPLAEEYCKKVLERTDGHVNIVIYPGEQLGFFEQTFEETMRGTIEFGFHSVPATYDNRLECGFIPGAYSTHDKLAKFTKPGSTVYNAFSDALGGLGITMLSFMCAGYNNLGLNCDLPEGYADPTVQKDEVIRVPISSETMDAVMKAMGYKTAPLGAADVYSSLQTGVVDGTLGQNNSMFANAYSDVVKNVIDTQLVASIDCIFINTEVLESMPEEYQQVLWDCAQEFYDENIAFLVEEDAAMMAQMEEKGITVTHLTDEQRAILEETMKEQVWPSIEAKGSVK